MLPAAPVPRALTRSSIRRGARALAARDQDLARLFRRVGEPPMWGRRPGFPTLIRIILEQQVSLAAARTMYSRLTRHLGDMTPERLSLLGVSGLRTLGFTRQKASYCHGLAERVLDGSLDLAAVARAPDAAGRAMLLSMRGLGPWTVDIYYLMALRRPDVWPRGDLALASALREVKRLDRAPTHDEQARLARSWAPWRSVAARLLWQHYLSRKSRVESQESKVKSREV